MDRPASPGSRADDRNPRRSGPTGRRSSISEWWSHASRSWTYEEGGPQEECATARARPRTVRRQGRYGQHRVDRAETGVLSDPGETRDGSARSPALQRHDLRPGRAVRAAQPPRPELPAAWRARRRRYHLAQDRRPGEGVFHRAPASRAGAPQMSDRVLAALEGGVRSEEHTSELQSRLHLVCRLLLEKKKKRNSNSVESLKQDRRENSTHQCE